MRISDWSSDVCSSDLADVESAIALAGEVPAISVIGGAEIFALFLPLATRIELTEMQVEAAGDTVMPPFSPAMWRETAREAHAPEDGRPGYSLVTLARRGAGRRLFSRRPSKEERRDGKECASTLRHRGLPEH